MTDDIFALPGDWLRRFRDLVTRETTPLPYRCLSRADLLCDAAYVDDLAASGCDEVWLGAESGSDRILAAMDKGSTVAEIRRASRNLQDRGVRVGFFLQLGYPGETLQDVQATVRMVEELRPSFIGVSVSYPLPGTVFHARVAGSLKGSSWTASMDNRTLYEAPFADAFYTAAKELLRSTHSAGRATDSLRAFLRHPGRRTGRRVAGAAFHAARLPLVRRRLERAAVPNPDAVPLTW